MGSGPDRQLATDAEGKNTTHTNLGQRVAALEKQLLEEALVRNGHNQRLTANALGLSYDQLRGMVRKYKLSKRSRNN